MYWSQGFRFKYYISLTLGFLFCMRHSIVCPIFDHENKRTSNKVMKCLCLLVESSAQSLREVLLLEQEGLCFIRKIWRKFRRFALTLTKSIPLLVLYAVATSCSLFLTGTSLWAACTHWQTSQSYHVYEPYAPNQEVSNFAQHYYFWCYCNIFYCIQGFSYWEPVCPENLL